MAELGRSAVEDVDRTYGVLLEEGGEEGPENGSFALQPPLANQEEFSSRPESSISRSSYYSPLMKDTQINMNKFLKKLVMSGDLKNIMKIR